VAVKVVAIGGVRVAPATMNRRIASVRGLFEYLVTVGSREDNPVPAARRSSGLRTARRGLLGHLGPGRPRGGGRLVRQPQRLPESLVTSDVTAFFTDLETHRDREIHQNERVPVQGSWTEILGSERLTGATLDLLTHRCKIIETRGEGYRLHDAKARTRRTKPASPVDEAQAAK